MQQKHAAEKTWRADIWKETSRIVEADKGYFVGATKDRASFRSVSIAGCQGNVKKYPNCGGTGPRGARYTRTLIRVENADCVVSAVRLIQKGSHPLLMDAASRGHFGGGYKGGSRAQEEELCRRSALACVMQPLEGKLYPLAPEAGIYCPPVPFFRKGPNESYALTNAVTDIAVGIVAAYNRPPLTDQNTRLADTETRGTREMIRTFFQMALENGHNSVVCVPLGCGAYRNPALHVAELFLRELIEGDFKGCFETVVFSILDDHNAYHEFNPFGNYAAFGLQALSMAGNSGAVSVEVLSAAGRPMTIDDLEKHCEAHRAPEVAPAPSPSLNLMGKQGLKGPVPPSTCTTTTTTTTTTNAGHRVEVLSSQQGQTIHMNNNNKMNPGSVAATAGGGADAPQQAPLNPRCPAGANCRQCGDDVHRRSLRHPCKFWDTCTKCSDPEHTRHFIHPCKFGPSCFRTNPEHLLKYEHTSAQPHQQATSPLPPNVGGRRSGK